MKTPLHRRAVVRWGAALALVAAAAFIGQRIALQTGLSRLQEAADHRLDMLATGLDADLARFDYLPALLEMTPAVPALLDVPTDAAQRDAVNRYLAGVNATAGAEMLYVLNTAGTSLAASDWDRPGTTVGQDLSFRPYVIDALRQGRGRFYGMGITSRKPGYYLSYALPRGVVAVKVDIEAAEAAWRKLPGDVMLVDERGVVILATRQDLKFRPLLPLDAVRRAEAQRFRPYGDADLQPLHWRPTETLGEHAQIAMLDGRAHLASTRAQQRAPWRLMVLDDLEPVRRAAQYAAITAGLARAVLLLGAAATWQRRRALRQKLAAQAELQAAHDNLESTVVARTAELRAAQGELVHAGKMAALGQMSAAMAHELNQPLTAMRTLSESAEILLAHNRPDEVQGNLRRIAGMVDRLARITSQLKLFAYKNAMVCVPVPIARVLSDAHAGVARAARDHGVQVTIDIDPPGLCAMAEDAALDSVVQNLMKNAIEAMKDAPRRLLTVEARAAQGRVSLSFQDSGPGIHADVLSKLFEPFVTTKPAGAGLGLGLVIAAQLVREMGGTLQAFNRDEGGACFVVDLPAPKAQE